MFRTVVPLAPIAVEKVGPQDVTQVETQVRTQASAYPSEEGQASTPSQTARTPLGVYGFPLIIFAVLRMNQFVTIRANYQSFPSAFPH